jgi:serine protease Do
MNKNKLLLSVFGSAMLGSAVVLGAYHFFVSGESGVFVRNENPPQYKLTNSTLVPGNLDFTYAAEVSTPTVVHITTYQKVVQRNYGFNQDPFQDEFFRQFFGEGFPSPYHAQPAPKGNDGETTEQKAGSGSGVILSADGYIVTNNHVVKGADKIEVVLNDKRRYKAELIGVDPTTDLAVLKIEEKNLAYVKYGNSDKLKIGEWVVAVGNPFDLTSTVTAGIVSAKARNINILKDKENMAIESFIQTDAAVNPGNSGGALVNLQGELIGINTAIATPTGTFAGYSFAVPSTLVEKVVEDLIKFGQVQRALLGVNITEITADLKEQKNLDKIEGVYISSVREGSSAAEAGLKEGDVILKINDNGVNSSSELQENVALYRPGDKITVIYKRNGSMKSAEVILKNKMGNTDVVKKDDVQLASIFNCQIREINDEEKEELGIENGLKIITLGEGKLKNAGIKTGFVITKVDKKAVTNPNDLLAYLENHEGALLIEGKYNKNQSAYFSFGN